MKTKPLEVKMSKAEINNEIILMRKVVRQAKVRSVRKWIKKAAKLKNRKGNTEQLEKNKLHSEKVIARVLAIKHVKDDEISTFALTDGRTQKQILDDQKLSPRELGIALITFCPVFQNKLAEFKNKFPNYLEFLEGKKNKPKEQTKQNKSGEKKPKKNPEKSPNKSPELARKLEKVKNGKVQKEEESENDSRSSDDLVKKFNIKPGSLVRLKPPEDAEDDSEEEESDSEEEIVPEKVKKQKVTSCEIKQKKSVASGSPKKFSSPKKRVNEEMQMEADPFFVSNDSSTYMRVKTQKSYETNQTGGQEKNFNQKFRKFGNDGFPSRSNDKSFKPKNERFGNKQFGRDKFHDKFGDKSHNFNKAKYSTNHPNERFERKPNRNEKFSKEKKGDFSRNNQVPNKFKDSPKKQKVLQTKKIKSPEKQQNLHPSWEAKKKQQEALKLGFQGKKIVFDD